jgi:hypothetical protein
MKFMHDTVLRALMAASLAAASLQPAFAAAVAPPKRDGSSGSFDAQFGNGPFGTDEWNLTTGQVYEYIGGGYTPAFTVPFKTITYNGQTVHAFEFSSLTMEPTLKIIVFGSTAVLLSQGNIDIAGQFEFPNGTLGGTPSTGNDGDFNGGSGQVAGGSGGGGGYGQGGYIQTACAGQGFSGGGGGGGGNYSPGTAGLRGAVPAGTGVTNPPAPLKGGKFGHMQNANKLLQGGAGGAGGGGNSGGEYFGGSAGGNGGAAVVLGARGTITIESTGVLNSAGLAGSPPASTSGSSGGGAGGDVWLFAKKGFSNAGRILANGGAGGTSIYNHTPCEKNPHMADGPNGGDGSGGVVLISAPSITNTGTINFAGGGGSGNDGELVTLDAPIANSGKIIGNR